MKIIHLTEHEKSELELRHTQCRDKKEIDRIKAVLQTYLLMSNICGISTCRTKTGRTQKTIFFWFQYVENIVLDLGLNHYIQCTCNQHPFENTYRETKYMICGYVVDFAILLQES